MGSAGRRILFMIALLVASSASVFAQTTTTYYLHSEDAGSPDFCCYALKIAGPDSAAFAFQSGDLKNHGIGVETLCGISDSRRITKYRWNHPCAINGHIHPMDAQNG